MTVRIFDKVPLLSAFADQVGLSGDMGDQVIRSSFMPFKLAALSAPYRNTANPIPA